MKTIIIIVVLVIISYYPFKSLYLTIIGKKGCSCNPSQKKGCMYVNKCSKIRTKDEKKNIKK